MKHLFRLFHIALSIGVTFAAIYWVFHANLDVLQDTFETARYEFLLLSLPLYLLAQGARAIRWRFLLDKQIPLATSFHVMNIGYMLGLLPLRLGELARAWLVTQPPHATPFFTSLSSIVLERLLDMLTVVLMFGLALLFLPVPPHIRWLGGGIGLTVLIILGVAMVASRQQARFHRLLDMVLPARLNPFVKRASTHFLTSFSLITERRKALPILLWTGISWSLTMLLSYCLFLAFFQDALGLPAVMLTSFFLAFAIAIPSVPGNIGTFEVAGVAGLWIAGVIASPEAPENAPALAFSLMLHAVTLGGSILLGMLGLWAQGATLAEIRHGVQRLRKREPVASITA